jgi:hypothetical protein
MGSFLSPVLHFEHSPLITFHFLALEGARPGAGRKPEVTNRPQLRDQLTKEQNENLVAKADVGDSLLLKFMLKQIFGKAPRPLTGDEDNPIYVKGVEVSVRRN